MLVAHSSAWLGRPVFCSNFDTASTAKSLCFVRCNARPLA
jgi:hypothetical protein